MVLSFLAWISESVAVTVPYGNGQRSSSVRRLSWVTLQGVMTQTHPPGMPALAKWRKNELQGFEAQSRAAPNV
jgi:hypothetical protein